jgi:hypothetical protein
MDAAECRTRPLACRLVADRMLHVERRDLLLDIAETWEKLAREGERARALGAAAPVAR